MTPRIGDRVIGRCMTSGDDHEGTITDIMPPSRHEIVAHDGRRHVVEDATRVLDIAAGRLRELLAPHFTGDISNRVEALNLFRSVLREFSPFRDEPVDYVEWVPADQVEANDYNPNSVAPPEMELLRLSIMSDGYTQPIVTNREDSIRVVVDGFHRNRVGKECPDVQQRIKGHLPVVQIRAEQVDRGDRIASTIRHNRARGKHQVVAMSEIVLELKRRNWSDEKIGRQLGMDPDEVLRLAQITGLSEAFANREFSEAWEAELSIEADDELEEVESA